MTEYIPIILNLGLNDVTYMVDGIITEVNWDVPIYFLRGNVYENIGSISEIRRRGTFNNNITDSNNVPIGTVDELSTNRLFIRNSEEEKKTPPKLRGGKTSNKRRKTKTKTRKTRKTKRRRY